MTPTRALVGLAVAATAGYVAINSVSDQGPQYVGDFPSIMEEGQANPAPAVPGVDPGPPVPDPPHYDAQPVVPEAPAAPPAGPAGPGPVGPAAPPGGGGTGGQGGYPPPGVGSPLDDLQSGLGFLFDGPPLLQNLTEEQLAQICVQGGAIIARVPCDQIPDLPDPPPVGLPLP